LQVNGSLSGTSAVTVKGGVLNGSGTINGVVTVTAGGTLSAGTAKIGMLTINNALSLDAGSVTRLRLSKNGGAVTNDVVKTTGALTRGGMLMVTDVGTNAVAANDTFKLFNASSSSGTFSAIRLPPLRAGLAWDTSTFGSTGTIKAVTPPTFSSGAALGGGQFVLTFSGANGQGYSVLTSTNVAFPLASWMVLTSGTFSGTPVIYTNTTATNATQFYIIKSP